MNELSDKINLNPTESKDTRSGFGAGLSELGEKNNDVVALCADLTGSLKMDAFRDSHPDRFFQVGIAEANMIGMAASRVKRSYVLMAQSSRYFLVEYDYFPPTQAKKNYCKYS